MRYLAASLTPISCVSEVRLLPSAPTVRARSVMTRVLLVDPDAIRRESFVRALDSNGLQTFAIGDGDELASSDLAQTDVVVSYTDLRTGDGLALRSRIGGRPLILFTDDHDVRRAVDAMRRGAIDYLVCPFDPGELAQAVSRALEAPEPVTSAAHPVPVPMVGRCPAMLEMFERIEVLAQSQSVLLIRGESGSGKELVARAVHAASSRRGRSLVALNCATIPPSLMESELFGDRSESGEQRRGLVEAADGSTLFLDEISSLTPESQNRLLDLLQERDRNVESSNGGVPDVRIIAATHRDLAPLVESGRFSAPLYERLIATVLTVPPLRDRGSDIVELAGSLLRRIGHDLSKPELRLSERAIAAITHYEWPGNVRELENALERAVILCDTGVIEPELLAIDTGKTPQPAPTAAADETDTDTTLERYFVKFVLDHQDAMTETELASKLGISRKSLWERRQRLNIPRKRSGARAPRRGEGT